MKKYLSFFIASKLRIGLTVVVLAALAYGGWKYFGNSAKAPQYQTAQAQKGTLITSVSASGNITAGSSVDITTQATGTVSNVYVHDGEQVTQGQKIADITLDQASQQRQLAAWSNYLQAKSQLDSANNNLNSLQNTEFTANQKFINDAVARGLATNDPVYIEENAAWLAAESSYKNQQDVISQAQASLNSAALAYQQISSTINAPATGTLSNFILTPGLPITSSSNNSTTTTSQILGSVTLPQGGLQATVNLSESDAPKVAPGQKVTLTLDAFPDQTFTGRVLTINTNGVVSSGVTTYPATISLDTSLNTIYPNMGIDAKIITKIENNVVLVPSQAVQRTGGQTTIRELKNGQLQSVPVTVGDSSDTQTVITSGVNDGDMVVTSVLNSTAVSNSTTSPFSAGGGGFRGGFGGGAARGGGRGG